MKIIKHGDLFSTKKKFACSTCGCIFLANQTEYEG